MGSPGRGLAARRNRVGYRACRRSTVIDAMACLATGLPWCVAGLALGTPELTAAGAALAGFAVLTALDDDAGCGAGLATIGRLLSSRLPGWHSASGAVFGGLGVLVAGLALFVAGSLLAGLVLDRLAWGLRWSLWLTGRTPPEGRVAAGAVSVAAASGLTWLAGPAAVRHGIGVTAVAVMPAVTVAAVGGWAAVLVHWRCRGARRRALRYGGDAVAAAVAAEAILLLVDRNLLGAQAAAGLLFPVAVWLSVVGWRAMNDAGHVAVRAAADIVVSLMLGSSMRARGELAAYWAVRRNYTMGELPVVVPLADLVLQIDRTSELERGHDGATGVELDLARRLGELQAVTLAPRPPDIARAAAAATGRAGLAGQAPGRQEESRRLARLDSAEKQDDATGRLADQAAELAASAVARALQLPGLGNTEVVQVIKEYLSGLIENSR